MKKIISLLLILATFVALFGCTKTDVNVENDSTSVEETLADADNQATAIPEETTQTETQTEVITTTECDHSWNNPSSCTESRVCTKCGKKDGKKGNHSYSYGICTVCGEENPKTVGLRDALYESERYFTYLDIDADILETRIEIYRMSGSPADLLEIQETLLEMDGYYKKIQGYLLPYEHNLGLCILIDPEMPIVTSSSLVGTSSYIQHAKLVKQQYDSTCENWGVESAVA